MTTSFDPSIESTAGARTFLRDHPANCLRAVVVPYDGRSDPCTVSPRDVRRDQLTTAWLSADAGSFYDLAETR